MTNAQSKTASGSEGPKRRETFLTLVPEEEKLTSTNSKVFEVRSTPTEKDSPKVKLTVRVLRGNETPRQLLNWRKSLDNIIVGLNLSQEKPIINIIGMTMADTAHTVYKEQIDVIAAKIREARATAAEPAWQRYQAARASAGTGQPNGTANPPDNPADIRATALTDNYVDMDGIQFHKRVLYALMYYFLPQHIVPKVKRDLRKFMRKPSDMKVRHYLTHLTCINSTEIPMMPDHPDAYTIQYGTPLTQSELIEILINGTPGSWEKEMIRHDFDPYGKIPSEIVDFMERIERTESMPHRQEESFKKVVPKKNLKKTSRSHSKSDGSSKYCMLHGNNNSHDTDECKALESMAKKHKSNNYKSDGSKTNKTWSRKAEDAKKKTQKDLHLTISRIEAELASAKEELSSSSSERKRKSDSESDNDSRSEGEESKSVNLIESKEVGEIDFENLSLDDNDEITDIVDV